MYLNEYDILKRLNKNPNEEKKLFISPIISTNQFGSASFDLRLGTDFRVLRRTNAPYLQLDSPEVEKELDEYSEEIKCYNLDEPFILHPNDFVLANTLEFIQIPKDLVGVLHGRSSWGRAGLLVHAPAGFVDPGFTGHLTFELMNAGKLPIPLYPGVRLGQIGFLKCGCEAPTKKAYAGENKYQFQMGAEGTKVYEDDEFTKVIQNKNRSQINI